MSPVEIVQASGDAGGLPQWLDWPALQADLLRIVLILLVTVALYRAIVHLTRRMERRAEEEAGEAEEKGLLTPRKQRVQTVAQLTRYVSLVGLGVLAAITILNLFVPIGGLLAGVGVFGLAVGFGAQTLVRDVISGVFILAEGQFAVGDVIRVNEKTAGQVERMTLRVVVLRDIHGVVHIIPNGEIKQVSNLTKGWSRALVEIGVAYGEDVDRVIATLEELGWELWEDPEWRDLLVEEPVVPGVERFEDSAVVIRTMVKTLPLKQFEVMREMRRRIKNRFDERGIEIPFPHRTLYWGQHQGRPTWMSGAGSPGRATGEGTASPSPEEDEWE